MSQLTFSLVIETENLRRQNVEDLFLCLNSLEAQSKSISSAKEIWLMDCGPVDGEILCEVQSKYQWLRVYRPEEPLDYYEAKMHGALKCTSDVVIWCDSDCTYFPEWLEGLLAPFVDSSINIVRGETQLRKDGAGSLMVSATLYNFFSRFSNHTSLYETETYYANNVAFRRKYLLDHPIPLHLPAFRGNCSLHCTQLLAQGDKIWAQPKAKAIHDVPTVRGLFARMMLHGYDFYVFAQYELHSRARENALDRLVPVKITAERVKQIASWRETHIKSRKDMLGSLDCSRLKAIWLKTFLYFNECLFWFGFFLTAVNPKMVWKLSGESYTKELKVNALKTDQLSIVPNAAKPS